MHADCSNMRFDYSECKKLTSSAESVYFRGSGCRIKKGRSAFEEPWYRNVALNNSTWFCGDKILSATGVPALPGGAALRNPRCATRHRRERLRIRFPHRNH